MFWVFSYGTVCLHWRFAPSALILAVCSFSWADPSWCLWPEPPVCPWAEVPAPPPEPGQCHIVTAWPATPTQPCCRAELTGVMARGEFVPRAVRWMWPRGCPAQPGLQDGQGMPAQLAQGSIAPQKVTLQSYFGYLILCTSQTNEP